MRSPPRFRQCRLLSLPGLAETERADVRYRPEADVHRCARKRTFTGILDPKRKLGTVPCSEKAASLAAYGAVHR
jgi:hypothetical protein